LSQISHQKPSFKVHISSGQGLKEEHPIKLLIVKVIIVNEKSAQGQNRLQNCDFG
jgi:hypothetical protein